ncbi:putative zinc finger protein [Orchesella cincta]|uniref:Putative zinc finger protein n=1 Tax=Orchesella cincta TaxID=48709 RepID=A0A1D2NK91_ORCCI|nr:putative zinc finger protein [Orchesella cincta]
MQLLSKVKELGEKVTQSKKSVSSKLAVGLLKQICVQTNMSNYLVVDQLRRKIIEKCSSKAQKMLPTIVLKRHVPDLTVTIALVSLIVLFSLIHGWNLQEISDNYLAVSEVPDCKEIPKSSPTISCSESNIPDESKALCVPDNMSLKRTRTRGKTSRRSSHISYQNFIPSEHIKTEGFNATKDEFVVAEEELVDHLADDYLENQGDIHFGDDDPEWMPEGCEDFQPDPEDDDEFPKEKKFKADDKPSSSNSPPEVEQTITQRRRGRPPKGSQIEREAINDPSKRCQWCNLNFKTQFLLCDHIATVHENIENPFECQTCHKLYDGFKDLEDHLMGDHEDLGDSPFFCWFCDRSYCTQQLCDIHRRFHHFTQHQQLFCDDDECQVEFACAKDQNEHLKRHLTPEQSPEEHIFICKKCGRGFLSKYRLQLHELTHWSKNSDGFFKCDLCWASYRNTSVLMNHYNRIHLGENKLTLYRCQTRHCLLYEITQKELDTHEGRHELSKAVIAAKQVISQKYKCKKKKKKKASANEETDNDNTTHQRKRKKTFSFFCEECGLEFKVRNKLERHKFVHGEPQFPCGICKKKYRRQDHLDIHIIRIHSKANLLICDLCGKACPTPSELRYHVLEHEQRYQCHFCPRRFSRRTILTGHERTHTGEKLQCEWCPVAKSCLYDIKKHVRKCHPDEYKIHYSDGARTQLRYKIMKENAAKVASDKRDQLTLSDKANPVAFQSQSDESQQQPESNDDNSNNSNTDNVDEELLNLDNS